MSAQSENPHPTPCLPTASGAACQHDSARPIDHLQHALKHAAHYLPAQGPIGVFVHHNTLHAFQHLPFDQAVAQAAQLFGTEPFLSEEAYQTQRARGRILESDIDAILGREPDAQILPGRLTRRGLRRALLVPGVRQVNGRNIAWQIEEGGLLESFRSDLPPTAARALASDLPENLWNICCERLAPSVPPSPPPRSPAAQGGAPFPARTSGPRQRGAPPAHPPDWRIP